MTIHISWNSLDNADQLGFELRVICPHHIGGDTRWVNNDPLYTAVEGRLKEMFDAVITLGASTVEDRFDLVIEGNQEELTAITTISETALSARKTIEAAKKAFWDEAQIIGAMYFPTKHYDVMNVVQKEYPAWCINFTETVRGDDDCWSIYYKGIDGNMMID